MRLRTLLLVGAAVIAALTGCVAVVAVVLTSALARYTSEVERAHNAARTVELARESLLQLSEDSDVAYTTKTAEDERVRSEREATLMSRLAEARTALRAVGHEQSLDEATRRTHDYLVARRRAELAGGPLDKVVDASAPARRDALAAAGLVADQLSAELNGRGTRAHTWATIGDDVAVLVATLCLLAIGGVMIAMYRGLFRPLLSLTDAMRAFSAGNRGARANVDSSEEMNDLAATFNDLANREVRQDTDRLTFLAGVAHDLRNPLATLRVVTHHLGPGRPPPTQQRLRESMALIDRQVTRLERMVGDFLDASRIESGQLELKTEPTDLRAVVADAVELYRSSASDAAGHEIVFIQPEHALAVDIDSLRISQVINNLLSNALKYSPNGGDVVVTVSQEGDDAVVTVTDYGIGIARSDVQHIFEPFRRTGASRELAPGVGLGLSVSRRIVEAHHGRIGLTSTVGAGSTFSVRLPAASYATSELSASLH